MSTWYIHSGTTYSFLQYLVISFCCQVQLNKIAECDNQKDDDLKSLWQQRTTFQNNHAITLVQNNIEHLWTNQILIHVVQMEHNLGSKMFQLNPQADLVT